MEIGDIFLIVVGLLGVFAVVAIMAKPVIDMQNKKDGTVGWFQRKPKEKGESLRGNG